MNATTGKMKGRSRSLMLCSLEQFTCTPFNRLSSIVLPGQGSGFTLPKARTGEGQDQLSQLLQEPMGKGEGIFPSLTPHVAEEGCRARFLTLGTVR